MNTFRFNFSGEVGEDDINQLEEKGETIQWLDSEEVVPQKIKNLEDAASCAVVFACGAVQFGTVPVIESKAMASILKSGLKNSSENKPSDLIAGYYEGGLKIWECTYDLIQYLEKNQTEFKLDTSNVLDLGCGAGILGLYASYNRSRVTFQDYNKEVLVNFTIPNIMINIAEDKKKEKEIKRCKFYSGDWDSFNKKLPCSEVYDLIFTSETIYNVCNYEKLISIFVDRLSKGGAAYVAAKTHYFGVGGGTRQFEQSIQKSGKLISEVCWKSSGGIQREILKITHKL